MLRCIVQRDIHRGRILRDGEIVDQEMKRKGDNGSMSSEAPR